MIMEVNRNVHMLVVSRYPWLKEIPNSWPFIVKLFEEYIPVISYKVITWKFPENGSYKCNSDGACKGNPSPSSSAFCIRDGEGNLSMLNHVELKMGLC